MISRCQKLWNEHCWLMTITSRVHLFLRGKTVVFVLSLSVGLGLFAFYVKKINLTVAIPKGLSLVKLILHL